jgi:Mn-dependent DtxR family transcriptional regulator
MNIYESAEDYLESILVIQQRKGVVHSIDIGEEKGFSKASVSIAMKKLREEHLITVDDDGILLLTEEGRNIAQKTLEKHEFLTNFFIKIGVEPKLAEDEACEIEHSINEETFEKMKAYLSK